MTKWIHVQWERAMLSKSSTATVLGSTKTGKMKDAGAVIR